MTPQEHIAIAESLLDGPRDPMDPMFSQIDIAMSVNALAHAVIALAVELGVPHQAAPATGGTSA